MFITHSGGGVNALVGVHDAAQQDRIIGGSAAIANRMAETLGSRGPFITDPREIGPALARALASYEVWCLNLVLDPEAYRKSGQVSMAI